MNQHLQTVKKWVKPLLGLPLTLLALYFITSILWTSLDKISIQFHTINYTLLSIGLVCIIVFYALKSKAWMQLLTMFDENVPYLKGSHLLTISEIKRYIPGNIFGFISRTTNFKNKNLKGKSVVAGIVLESLSLVLSSLVISIPAVLFFSNIIDTYVDKNIIGMIGTVSGVVGVLLAYVFRKKITQVLRPYVRQTNGVLFTNIFFTHVVAWFIFGIGNYFIATAIFPISPSFLVQVASLSVLSWTIGYLSIVTPMGLGVREAVLIFGLGSIMPMYLATSVAVILRIAFIAGELGFLGVISFSQRFKKALMSIYTRFTPSAWIVLILALIYALFFSHYTIEKHNNFFTGRFDLGNMDQVVWNTSQGRIFTYTNPDSTNITLRFSAHSDVILIALAPFYWIWSDPRMLLILQSIVLGVGGIFVYLLAREVIKHNGIATAFAISYFLNPFVQRQNSYDFHAVTFATTFFLIAFYFLAKKRYYWATLFVALASTTKENIFLITTLFGVYLIIKRKVVLGSMMVASSLGIFMLLMKHIIPSFRGGEHFALNYLSEFGDSTGEVFKNIIFNPVKTFSIFLEHEGFTYLFRILLPVGFLSLGAPLFLIFAGPDILKNLLSSNGNLRQIYYQYMAEIIPFVYISAIYGTLFIRNKVKRIPAVVFVVFIIVFGYIAQWNYGVLPGGKRESLEIYNRPTKNASEIRSFLARVSEDASVASSNNIGAHLAHRERLYTIPNGVYTADYVIFLLSDKWASPSQSAHQEMVQKLLKNEEYELIYQKDEFFAFKRR